MGGRGDCALLPNYLLSTAVLHVASIFYLFVRNFCLIVNILLNANVFAHHDCIVVLLEVGSRVKKVLSTMKTSKSNERREKL